MKTASERIGIIAAACLLSVLLVGIASAGPDLCLTVDGEIITCTGNQSQGIASGISFQTPPANTLNVNSLTGPIQPTTPGAEGISFINYSGSGVAVQSGTSQDNVVIVTNGANAMGILVGSQGTPTSFTYRGSITIYVPNAGATGGGSGGPVAVENYGTITTDGSGSHGIVATNQTGGFPTNVTQSLESFNLSNITLSLETVAGSASYIDCTVQGSGGGTFILHPDGTFGFALDNTFDTLQVGQVAVTEVNYQVRQTSIGGATDLAQGVLQVGVTRADNGALVWAATNHFDEYVGYDNYSTVSEETPLWPDLQSYVNGLKGDAGLTTDNAAGLFVRNYGNIETKGASSIGIIAQTYGGAGASGRNGGGFWSFGTKEPTSGKQGANGGGLVIVHDGSLKTSGPDSPGIVGLSRGGTGGKGGDGGFYYSGRQGGKGGNGGDVVVSGSGTIATVGDRSSGILAVSEGGVGGAGGGDSTWVDGGGGGYGGSAGSVVVDGAFHITTNGTESHGIWAKSIGGSGGQGGTGGVFGSGGSGGGASNGGNVSVTNAGEIRTTGDYSYGIYGMSVGGFGGDGGSASGLFVSYGGSGSSAGDGGAVSITNTGTGIVSTGGEGSHAIFAQSIGGGGGSGGSASALVGLGGTAAAGGFGGAVSVVNNGQLTTTGAGARGVYAQSIGGGGGDGGNSSGLVSIGGTGSGTSDGGVVHVVNAGNITTTSYSIFAQSIGGGGGDGGDSTGWFSVGGKGGGGGDAGNVTVINSGNMQTSETNASAIFAQSVGGGGGNGGNSTAVGGIGSMSIGGSGATGGTGGMVTVGSLGGTIVTLDNNSRGIQAQSVGGGGGSGGFAFAGSGGLIGLSFAVGGQGGKGGSADNVSVDSLSDITTYGENSHGIFAQSVGGGGGSGGFGIAVSGGIFSGSFAMGGKGGTAGNGGSVNVGEGTPLSGTIRTYGDHSYGILAQSVGGGGGDGGYSLAASAGAIGASLSFGGEAGTGGTGGDVTVRSANDTIVTIGSNSHGIVAQSVGGGGGTGGFSISGSAGIASVGASFGGAGGNGGHAGDVEVSATGGEIRTRGYHSYGILAQSIGGSGGDGGYSVSGGISLGASFNFAMGGSGGSGGSAGMVTVDSAVNVFTDNTDSHAIFAQSVGGGGGSGGFSATGGISAGVDIGASIGGGGGGGGKADNVAVTSTGSVIQTSGERSYGILAQSIGGTGGDGGFAVSGGISGIAGVNFAMGGSGGEGGDAGAVSVETGSAIATFDNNSHAIFAQSVGGGGGSGGFSAAGGISAGVSVGAGIGGDGGKGGQADTVNVRSTGAIIQTLGERSYGILAQSIGGTGGDGGFAVSGGVSSIASVSFAMGGKGGEGGVAGAVSVDSSDNTVTLGNGSHAIFAQSVGGGGGSGGFSATGGVSAGATVGASIGGEGGKGGQADTVSVRSTGAIIQTSGERSYGILAQSIGGTGGDGGFGVAGGVSSTASVSFGMGGSGGAGGKSGAVSVDSASNIVTDNNSSHAIFAQSVGGGGGSGGFSATGGVSGGVTVGASIGGAGGAGAQADNVAVTSTGSIIQTSGERSYGILAQSIGGTGGDGGFGVSGGVSSTASVDFAMGGSGGLGGVAGAVSVDSSSAIATLDNNSHAIFAQSVGGGGGSGGFSATGGVSGGVTVGASIGGAGGSGGVAKSVNVRSTGATIQTAGERSYGILAQSVGGTGGDGGFSVAGGVSGTASVNFAMGGSGGTGGLAGAVSVNSVSNIFTDNTDSHAIFAQSVGGGGGSGGFSVTAGISGTAAIGAAIGGAGGDGATAGTVAVSSTGSSIHTVGERSYGILAQSIGGTGGDGGFSVAGGLSSTAAVNFAMGGSGGTGGVAGAVSVDSASDISTDGNSSHAIFAQSVGGGGGSGGFSVTAGVSGTAAIGAAIGGDGGSGGKADNVTVHSTGIAIRTSGDRSYGILAQSIGGTGGDGGFSVAGGLSSTAAVNFAMGGSGGAGGIAGAVSVDSSSDIATFDNNSHAIFAQSVGGGGGSGGFSVTGGFSSGAGIGASIGGAGGDGAEAGKVTVASTGDTIRTSGERSYGILAQSIGGTGGDGGFSVAGGINKAASVNFSLGGSGGTGGLAGAVSVNSISNIFTDNTDSHAIFAQSVGGGGGSGGFSVAGGAAGGGAVGVSIGGSGGDAGRADNVTVASTGKTIQTSGERSYGILAQSIGGTGGNGGFSVAGGISKYASVNFSLGGSGGTGGMAGAVSVDSSSDILTLDNNSHGIFAQSLGGGGGSGGFSVSGGAAEGAAVGISIGGSGGDAGKADNVTVHSTGTTIRTDGVRSYGILAQSIGGTGGNGGFSVAGGISKNAAVNFSLGGEGGAGALAGAVSVDSSSEIVTLDDDSHGIFAQSLGGGGGSGGFSVAGGAATGGAAIGISIGGSGGGGGTAKSVDVRSTGATIQTSGERSYGILAQSIGGTGGNGGFSVAGGISKYASVNFGLGGEGGGGGTAGTVSVDSSSDIFTLDNNSHGIFAQSLGGGGGSGGVSVAGSVSFDNSAAAPAVGISIGGSGGDGAVAGKVSVTNTGDVIRTSGERSYGILAQSIGGTGGNGGFSVAGGISKSRAVTFSLGGGGGTGSIGGDVDLASSGDVVTLGGDSHAVFAQSLGGSGGSGGFSVAGSVSTDDSALAGVGISIGGSGGGGGSAGNVTVTSTGQAVETFGERSYGILAQSLGGGGGSGGFSVAGVVSKGRGISFSMGGGGGTAGTGGTVAVDSSSDIVTHDNNSHGIFAQSVGGGGGSGGFSVAGSVSADNSALAAIGISVGGFGAGGGNADNVTVDSTGGAIVTEGARSYGILAQSVGGGGGDGGFSVAGGIGKGGGATFSLGGFGDTGGHGRTVDLHNSSDIATFGDGSHAIFAQSVGGGGGSGGFSVAGSVAWDNAAASVGISVGGFGGGGGNGGLVSVHNDGSAIVTAGDNAIAILAQSIGGGGGNGGFSVAGSFGFDNSTKNVSVAVGGFGGKGGFGGDVRVSNSAAIVTAGNGSEGILAQSVGGGGGSGGFAFSGSWGGAGSKNVSFSLGGYGGSGNYAGNVFVYNDNAIDTSGFQSHGIFAQSVGGGGGKGGWSIAAELGAGGDNTSRNVNLGIGIGGGGGDGGYGGAVTVLNRKDIVTRGVESHGILAQSLGGGGGNGGFAFSGMLAYGANDKGTNVNVAVAVGGGGGDGNHGGSVTVANFGDIFALDNNSKGIFAQSVGGGGGNGGQASTFSLMFDKSCPIKYVWCKESKESEDDWSFSVAVGGSGGGASHGGIVDVTNAGNIVTRGADSAGIFAQSIGGGGGNGGNGGSIGKSDLLGMFAPESLDFLFTTVSGFKEWDVMVGGSGGSSGNGDNVTVRNTGNIATYGSSTTMLDGTELVQDNVGSFGIFAQSIGGGGGVGGNASTGLFGKVGIGGGAGSSGDGGAVTVRNSGRIETFGDGGHAILAQSGGGGGGIAGDVKRFEVPLTDLNVGLNLAFGRGGGNGGDGGAVTVDSSGEIVTHGGNSYGIFAQSFGGGGGLAGNAGLLGFAGSVGGDGSGGAVTVTHSGAIVTHGDGSHGIFAQSAGGKGSGGAVHVTVSGDILAQGFGSDGIFAQSRGDAGHGSITVDIMSGTVQGGAGDGAAVRFVDGANNILTNHGTVTGSVYLGAGTNAFHNKAGGTFNPGANVYLGSGNTLTNEGTLSPGGAGIVQTTALAGNLVQTGNLLVDLDLKAKGAGADRVVLEGTADMAGSLKVNLMDPGWIQSGTYRYSILSGADNVSDTGLSLEILQPSAVLKYEMSFTGKDLEIAATVDFSVPGLTGNLASIGQAINAIQLAGGTEAFAPVAAELVRMTDPEDIKFAYGQMSPVTYANTTRVTQDVTRLYTQNLLKRIHSVRSGLQTADSRSELGDREQWLLAYSGSDESIRMLTLPTEEARRKTARYGAWLDAFGQGGKQDDSDGFTGYDFQSAGGTVGLDYLFGERFLAGVSVGMSGTNVDLNSQQGDSDIKGVFGSLYGSYFTRHLYLDMAFSYGGQSYDSTRNVSVGGLGGTASSDHDGDLFSGYVEGGYNFEKKNWIMQPYAGLQYIYLSEEEFSETGAGPLNLNVSSQKTGSLASELGLRLNYVIPVENGNFLPEVTVAWNYDFGIDDRVVTASFASAPGTSFSVNGQDPENNGLVVGAGITFMSRNGFSSSLKYRGDFRNGYQSHGILGELLRYEF